MGNTQLPENPFGKIALSCSGGGYRAASFHLGTMSYLNHVQLGESSLLEQVKVISTVSGGSITGVVYALMKQEGKSFDDVYHLLLERLINIDLLHGGINKLNPDAAWPYTFKRKNLINVFAEQYDQAFTNGALMGVFDEMQSHLEAVVFNCTEFENAVNFRFRNAGWSYSGNYYNRIPARQLREVKLSDVMASSSCFPGGFEPMCWPDDFVHEQSPNLRDLATENAALDISPLGIMDGGIYDNQGIDSILRYKEGGDKPYFDLIILSDVASPDMKAFVPFKEKPKSGFRTLTLKSIRDRVKRFDKIGSLLLCIVSVLGIAAPFIFGMDANWLAGVCWTVAAFALLLLGARTFVKKKLKSSLFGLLLKIRDHIPPFYLKRLSNFDIGELSVHRAEPLIMDRVNSLLTLLTSVFLKVVRRLNYNRLYEDETYQFRRVSTLIKCLTKDNFAVANNGSKVRTSFFEGNYNADVGPAIQALVEEAAAFGTTLWFTEQEKLDNVLKKLVATGQITLCYNLILYIEQLMYVKDQQQYASLDPSVRLNINALYQQCLSDWARFRKDPMFLVGLKEGRLL